MIDLDQFELLFRASSPRLLATAIAICRNRDTAQDLVQEAGLIAWRKRSEFEERTNFGAWAGQIVRNLALRHNRDAGRRSTVALDETYASAPNRLAVADGSPGTETQEILGSADDSPEQLGDRLGLDDAMADAIQGLGEPARSCFLLKTLGQLSYDEIAQVLEVPPGTAMSHVHRSRKRILTQLARIRSADPIQGEAQR